MKARPLTVVIVLIAVLVAVSAVAQAPDRLRAIADRIVSGGPPRDGIPAIDRPRFISVQDADEWLRDDDVVFGLVHNGVVRAYPQQILVWHEIVNDTVAGAPLAVTYCPLTGSPVAFLRHVGTDPTRIGVSGSLVNSNLVMVDDETDSLWPQILGTAVEGRAFGRELEQAPVVFTTWRRWKAAFPESEVLSRQTGVIRPYGRDPYGSYPNESGYYFREGVLFPLMHESDRFPQKEMFIGVKKGGDTLAVHKELIRTEKVVATRLGGRDIVVIYEGSVDDALAYEAGGHTFTATKDGVIDERGVRWDVFGRSARGEQLRFVPSFDVMWFAWSAFYPDSKVAAAGGS